MRPLPFAYLVPLLLVVWNAHAFASANGNAKIAAHIQSHPTKGIPICDRGELPACNEGESSLTITAASSAAYDVYFLVLDGDSTAGIGGASFGIEYDGTAGSGVDIRQWYLCADAEYENSWPDSGSGTRIVWLADTNCQRTPAVGDSTKGVTGILGVAYLYAYSSDVLTVTRNEELDESQVVSCGVGTDDVLPKNLGKISFGGAGEEYDPCKGPLGPYSEFQGMSSQELATAEVKLTYGSGHSKLDSIILTPTGHSPDISLYRYFYRWDFNYSTDSTPNVYRITVAEIEQIIDDVSTLSGVTAGGDDLEADFSFALFNVLNDTTYVFESLVPPADGSSLFAAIIGVPQDSDVIGGLSLMACRLDASPPGNPSDVTDQATVELEGFRLDHTSGLFVVNLKVTNTGASTLASPLSLALGAGPSPVRVVDPSPSGVTCELDPPGRRYIDLPVGSGLAPSASVEITLKFSNPNKDKIIIGPKLYSGSGSR